MTTRPTNEEIRILIDGLRAPAYWFSGSSAGHEGENDRPLQAADALEAVLTERQAARAGVGDEVRTLNAICDLFQIGSAVRDHSTILTNIENVLRRSQCLWAIEHEFFTREVPDEDGDEGETVEDCDLSWGAAPAEYVEQFRAALQSIAQPVGEVVVTKNEAGQIVAVTRQDKDGRVLEVIAEPTARPVVVLDKKIEEALDIFYGCIHWRGFGERSLEGANGVKKRMRNAIESAVHTVTIPDALGHSRSMVDSQYVEGWNACREAILSTSPQPQQAVPSDGFQWIDGIPAHPWDKEWFIAELDNGDRVVLKALPKEYTYDFKTADETYLAKRRVKRWMQFPDSEFVAAPAYNGKKEG